MSTALVVETLAQKLARLVPGAVVALHRATKKVYARDRSGINYVTTIEEWRVTRAGKLLATAASEREAIDRALFLWGAR